MARGRRAPRLTAAQAQALTSHDLIAQAQAVMDAARDRANQEAWERAAARLGRDGRAGLEAFLATAPDMDEDVATLVDVSAAVTLLTPDGESVARVLRLRGMQVLQLRADWASAALIRVGTPRLMEWASAPGADASADQYRWWLMSQQFEATDPTSIRRAATTQAEGADTVTRPSGMQLAAADAAHRLRIQAEAAPVLAHRVSELLLSSADDDLVRAYVGAAMQADDMAGLAPAADHDFTPARRLAQAYADAGLEAPVDLAHPHTVTDATLERHGHERRSGRRAAAHDDELRRRSGSTHGAATAIHAAWRALDAGQEQAVVEVRHGEMAEFLQRHGDVFTEVNFAVRTNGEESGLVAVTSAIGTIDGEVRSVIVESVILRAQGQDPLTRQRLAEQALMWRDDNGLPGTQDVTEILHWDPPQYLTGVNRPRSAPRFASPADMLGITPCAHDDVHWEENRTRDARVLCCHGCGARHLATVPLHRVPGAKIQPAKAYLARECFYAALEGREPAATSLAALKRIEGEMDMSPRAHLPSLFVFPDEQDLASALFG